MVQAYVEKDIKDVTNNLFKKRRWKKRVIKYVYEDDTTGIIMNNFYGGIMPGKYSKLLLIHTFPNYFWIIQAI